MLNWRWWKNRSGDEDIDEWVRHRLSVDVPEDSFERVWTQVQRRIGQASVGQQAPWELTLMVRRLQLWTRGLAGGLVVVTAILTLVLTNAFDWMGTPSVGGDREHTDAMVQGAGILGGRPRSTETHYASYHLLKDNRIIYGGDEPKGGR